MSESDENNVTGLLEPGTSYNIKWPDGHVETCVCKELMPDENDDLYNLDVEDNFPIYKFEHPDGHEFYIGYETEGKQYFICTPSPDGDFSFSVDYDHPIYMYKDTGYEPGMMKGGRRRRLTKARKTKRHHRRTRRQRKSHRRRRR